MKKILTLLVASIAIISVKAQKNADIAVEQSTVASDYKTNRLVAEPTETFVSDNKLQGTAKKGFSIMPNAATQDIKIVFSTYQAVDAKIEVIDENGKKVLGQSAVLIAGTNSINIDNFHSLNEGTYTIQLTSSNETHTSKFLYWK